MNRLFKKQVSVVIASYKSGSFFEILPNAVLVSKLRIRFDIKKTANSKPNTCKIVITNLAERTRNLFNTKPVHIQLNAGQDGVESRIFVGNMTHAVSQLNGVDWETTIQVGDGNRSHRYARVNKSYEAGATDQTVLNDLVKSLGLNTTVKITGSSSAGYSVSGPTRNHLTSLLRKHSLDWSIQGGQMVILADKGLRKNQAIVVSADSGMKGSPENGSPTKKKKTPELIVKSQLDVRAEPGFKMSLISRNHNGVYKIGDVKHTADTHGKAWDTTIKAITL